MNMYHLIQIGRIMIVAIIEHTWIYDIYVICRRALWNVGVLAPLLGVTWMFGVLFVVQVKVLALGFEIVFALLNSLQVGDIHSTYQLHICSQA